MIAFQRYILCLAAWLLASFFTFAQKDPLLKPDRGRVLFHDYVDKEQFLALRYDGKEDKHFTLTNNVEINFLVTNALISKVYKMQFFYEKDTTLPAQMKVRYIRGIEWMLKDFNAGIRSRSWPASALPAVLEAYEISVVRDRNGESIESV